MGNKPLQLVLSVCEKAHLPVWEVASRHIIKYIPAQNYLLLCPDSEIPSFSCSTHPAWQIEGESKYSQFFPLASIKKTLTGKNQGRANWLFQQFLKLQALKSSPLLKHNDTALLWDADTIPLKPLQFTEGNTLLAYPSREFHPPYFETLNRLVGFGKQCPSSFVAQCLPIEAEWVRSLTYHIESRFQTPFPQAILSSLQGQCGSEFSEYETLGNWAKKHHPNQITFQPSGRRWLRHGRLLTGPNPSSPRARLALQSLSLLYDYTSIELWGGALSLLHKKTKKLHKKP